MKTSQEQKIRREPFIRAVLVLDKTCSYKWYSSRLIFPHINGPIVPVIVPSEHLKTTRIVFGGGMTKT